MRRMIVTAAVLAAGIVQVHAQTPPPIAVENAWARATAGKTGAVYFTVVDHGAPDRLIALSTPVADAAQLHQSTMQNHIMQMRPVDGLAITPQAPVTLTPGGYHVMLTGLKQQLQRGQTFPITLTFQHAGAVQASVTVAGPGAMSPAPSHAGGQDMDMPMPMPAAK
jgi:periplasmic copper chaperone A